MHRLKYYWLGVILATGRVMAQTSVIAVEAPFAPLALSPSQIFEITIRTARELTPAEYSQVRVDFVLAEARVNFVELIYRDALGGWIYRVEVRAPADIPLGGVGHVATLIVARTTLAGEVIDVRPAWVFFDAIRLEDECLFGFAYLRPGDRCRAVVRHLSGVPVTLEAPAGPGERLFVNATGLGIPSPVEPITGMVDFRGSADPKPMSLSISPDPAKTGRFRMEFELPSTGDEAPAPCDRGIIRLSNAALTFRGRSSTDSADICVAANRD